MTLNPYRFIQKKRNGGEHTASELKEFIAGVVSGEIPDYQVTAWLMAVYFKGMTPAETVALTVAMAESGERYTLKSIPGPKADKHSTGGVGDKVSLILAPLAAACGLVVPMMAGRGLGHSGGTLDKLESIPGFKIDLSRAAFEQTLKTVGCAIIGQSAQMVPADKTFYALRDVTATIECIPLITASILSKKLAEGTETLVMDIKFGSGAFMKTLRQARELAKSITVVGKKLGLNTQAVLTSMDQPLGYAAGNAVEVLESLEILAGKKFSNWETSSSDLKELTLALTAQMLVSSRKVKSVAEGRRLAALKLTDGSALAKFRQMVDAQGGDVRVVDDPSRLTLASQVVPLRAPKSGYITEMDTEALGNLLVDLGGGRRKASDPVDPRVAIIFQKKLGAKVATDETVGLLLASEKTSPSSLKELETRFWSAVQIGKTRKPVPRLVLGNR